MNLDKLREIAAARTSGPWKDITLEVSCGAYCQGGSGVLELSGYPKVKNANYNDLQFIALAASCFEQLLDGMEALKFYAAEKNWDTLKLPNSCNATFYCMSDKGERARAALTALQAAMEKK